MIQVDKVNVPIGLDTTYIVVLYLIEVILHNSTPLNYHVNFSLRF